MRAGGASKAADNGVSDRNISKYGRWTGKIVTDTSRIITKVDMKFLAS